MKRLALPLVFAFALVGQTPDLTKPPVSPEQKPYKLPPFTETKLPNGLTVVLAEDARVPLVTVRLAFAAGTKRDPQDMPGLASAVGSMLMQGTKARTYQQLAEELDSLGATINASSTADATVIGGSGLAENTAKLIAIVSDIARNAQFPDSELALYKQNQKQGLLLAHSRPEYLASEEFRKRIFGNHPYSHMAATPESIDKMNKQALIAYRDAYLVPNNGYLIIVGKLPARAQVTRLISDEFGNWQKKDVPPYNPPAIPAAKRQLVLVDRPGSVQADVRIGRTAANLQSADFFAQSMGNMILGGGSSSRLFMDIREKRGYAYDVHTEVESLGDTGTFSTVTQVRNEVAPDALQGIMSDMDAMGKERVSKDELSGAKALANGRFLLRLEPQSGIVDRLQEMKILNLPKDFLDTYTTKVNSVEPDQILSVSKKYLGSSDDAIIVVGDAASLEKPLTDKLGKFDVVKVK